MDELRRQRAFYGLLALGSLGALGWGISAAGAPGLAFGLFAVMTLGGGLVCVWERSVVRSAFALMSTFVGIAGLFLLLESDFLAAAQILIYVGAILALILFGVMLTPPDLGERKLPRVLGGLAVMLLVTLWVGSKVAGTVHWATTGMPGDGAIDPKAPGAIQGSEWIGVGFLAADQYVVAFELAAVVLTVALVAAVYIARRRRVDLEPLPDGEGLAGPGGSEGGGA